MQHGVAERVIGSLREMNYGTNAAPSRRIDMHE
jgi:hypothetical protein